MASIFSSKYRKDGVVGGGSAADGVCGFGCNQREPTKVLVKVNIQNSLGPVQVIVSPENTVKDLIKAVVEMYMKEKRRPLLVTSDPRCFQLHYSQFNLEGLEAEEKLKNLGSRNFFLCQK